MFGVRSQPKKQYARVRLAFLHPRSHLTLRIEVRGRTRTWFRDRQEKDSAVVEKRLVMEGGKQGTGCGPGCDGGFALGRLPIMSAAGIVQQAGEERLEGPTDAAN